MKRGQKGFTVVETLLVLILLSILGFTGYYVYHSRNNTNATYNNATNAANSTVTSTSSGNFVFKEFGVQINLPSDLMGLAYTSNVSGGVTSLGLYTPQFETALHKCDPTTANSNTSPFMLISKMSGQYNQADNPTIGNLKQFSNFWISGATPNGIVCSATTSQQDQDEFNFQFHNSVTALQDAFKTATEVK